MLLCVCVALLLCSHSAARPMSDVLHSDDAYLAARDVSRKAQDVEAEEDSSIRLISGKVQLSQGHHQNQNRQICCLHANILDYYLLNVLQNHDGFHPRMPHLKTDLARISQDLSHHGCNVTHYHDHHNAVEFREKLIKVCSPTQPESTQCDSDQMQGQRGITKAIGEIDILFTYLQEYCVQN